MVHTASLSSTRQLRDRVWEEVPVTAMVCVASHEVLHLREQQFPRVVRDVTLYTQGSVSRKHRILSVRIAL